MSRAELSYVVVTDQSRTLRRLMETLRAQTDRARLEVVIVAPEDAAADVRANVPDEFAAVRVVPLGSIHPMAAGRAAGVRAATAPLVFIGETHSFPDPGFAAALLAADRDDWDVLVPALHNENPGNAISRSNFVMDYGTWHQALRPGAIPGGPTWNVAYRRSVLARFDPDLDRMLSHGDDLAVALQAAGCRTVMVPAAGLSHANLSQPRWWFQQRYLAGELVGESRVRRWPRGKRLLYAAASPLIPVLIVTRLLPAVRAHARDGSSWTTLPALAIGACFRTAGELMAYLRGAASGSQARMDEYELHKLEYTALSY